MILYDGESTEDAAATLDYHIWLCKSRLQDMSYCECGNVVEEILQLDCVCICRSDDL